DAALGPSVRVRAERPDHGDRHRRRPVEGRAGRSATDDRARRGRHPQAPGLGRQPERGRRPQASLGTRAPARVHGPLGTRRSRVAACVTNAVTRHPAITATAAASIDLIAPGRTVLGVGAGHSGVANVGSAPAPAAALGEAVTFMRRLLRGERASWAGGVAEIPWRRGTVPVYVAASGPKALRIAGEVADGAFVNYGLGKEQVVEIEAALRAGAGAAGRSR